MGSPLIVRVVEAEPGSTERGLYWFPVEWPSSWDILVHQGGPIEGTTPSGGMSVDPPSTLYEFPGEPDALFEEPLEVEGLLKLMEEDLSSIIIAAFDGTILFIAPAWEEEMRALHEEVQREEDWTALPPDVLAPSDVTSRFTRVWNSWAITPAELLSEIQYHLLEPTVDGGQTWQFWTYTEVEGYLKERVARFLMETRAVRSRTVVDITASTPDYSLDPTLALLSRVYKGGVLLRTSKVELDAASPTWETDASGTPRQFFERTSGTIRLYPTPTASGTGNYTWVPTEAVDSGDARFYLRPLVIPATFSWGIKYGVMADMLKREGEGQDLERAGYCESRYADGVALMRAMMGEGVAGGK